MNNTTPDGATPPPHGPTPDYSAFLREIVPGSRGPLRACWLPDTSLHPETFRRLLEEAVTRPDAVVLKEDRRTRVIQTTLLDHRVVIKSYSLTQPVEWIKYTFRHSPARRFWAAARTMQTHAIPTPAPLGLLEEYRLGIPVRSHIVTEYLQHSITLRQWAETRQAECPADRKAALHRQLLELLQALPAARLYHRDTKGENILITHADDPEQPTLHWIDLECVQRKPSPTRHDIIRNLVQLNGSVCHVIPEAERCAFLHRAAARHPWLLQDRIIRLIQNWTRRRLDKEKHETD